MPGAISLSGRAAIRSGAGLVTIATASSAQPVVAGYEACYMTIPLAEDSDGWMSSGARDEIANILERADSIAVGPGLGVTAATTELVSWLFRESNLPAPAGHPSPLH